jgi:polysaccharide export outer membrane protein
MQALAAGGGLTQRGTDRGIQVRRKDESGTVRALELKPNDPLESGDVIYVRESIF